MSTKNKKNNVEKKSNKIFVLTCEDASHLGGPMGSEYTEFLWNKLFSDRDKAKAHAEKYADRDGEGEEYKTNWQGKGKEISWDSGPYIFTIKEEKVL